VKVLVLMGGMSSEREVSLSTGGAVARGLARAGYDVSTYDLDPGSGRDVLNLVNSRVLKEAAAVFIALHGGEGEDGRIQALLELVDKPYTGPGVRSSAVCMDKAISKIIFDKHDIPTPAWTHLMEDVTDAGIVKKAVSGVGGLPVVIKPVDQGSTIGLSIVREACDLEAAIALARRYSPGLILEEYIEGRELSVPVIEDEVYPIIEIKPKEGFYDYERKYTKGMTLYDCPADLDEGLCTMIQAGALKAYRVLGCENFARVDLRLSPDNKPYFLEVNTVPGMTETSLVPMGAEAMGISFPQLVDRIVLYALKRAGISPPGGRD
jgi:D-alanine-D-alanine ligase